MNEVMSAFHHENILLGSRVAEYIKSEFIQFCDTNNLDFKSSMWTTSFYTRGTDNEIENGETEWMIDLLLDYRNVMGNDMHDFSYIKGQLRE